MKWVIPASPSDNEVQDLFHGLIQPWQNRCWRRQLEKNSFAICLGIGLWQRCKNMLTTPSTGQTGDITFETHTSKVQLCGGGKENALSNFKIQLYVMAGVSHRTLPPPSPPEKKNKEARCCWGTPFQTEDQGNHFRVQVPCTSIQSLFCHVLRGGAGLKNVLSAMRT